MLKSLKALAVVVPLVLGGCAGPDGRSLSPVNQVAQAGVTLRGAQSLILEYVKQPECSPPTVITLCADPEGKKALKKAEDEAFKAYKKARALADAGLDPKVSALHDLLRALTNELVRRNLIK